MDHAVWVPTVFSKNRERLIKHDAVIEFFNQIVQQAQEQELLSGEHFSVDGIRKVDQMFVLTMAGYNLTRLRSLGQIRLQGQM